MSDYTQPIYPASPVTLLDVFTKQIELAGQLALIHARLEQLPDHEVRIRSLERFRFTLFGAVVVVSCLISAGGTWLGVILTQH